MKWNKITTLIMGVFATSIVVFNNLIQIHEKIIFPAVRQNLIISFLLVLIGVIFYSIVNIKE